MNRRKTNQAGVTLIDATRRGILQPLPPGRGPNPRRQRQYRDRNSHKERVRRNGRDLTRNDGIAEGRFIQKSVQSVHRPNATQKKQSSGREEQE